jgi:FkbM family methyltransferase
MIRLRSTGLERPSGIKKLLLKLMQSLRGALLAEVRVKDRQFNSIFRCETQVEASRPMGLWVKEEGTMRWLDEELRAGDVFMDIGANIGIYTIAAAHRVGSTGKVYAFEPHKVNVLALMRNVAANNFYDRVTVFSCALSDRPAVARFNYSSIVGGSSGSQFGHVRAAGKATEFAPVAREMVLGTSVDALLAEQAIASPALIKIDVDGNELPILRGMRALLTGTNRPRAVQVEMNVGEQDAIKEFLAECGYEHAAAHFTRAGKNAAARGLPISAIAYNAIFRPTPPT